MTKLSLSAFLTGFLLFLSGCNPEDNLGFTPNNGPLGANPNGIFTPCENGVRISPDELPDEVRNYLSENYPGFTFDDIEQFLDSREIRFGIDIEYEGNAIEFYFETDGTVISFGDSQSSQSVAIDDLPAAILDYLETNFPDIPIDISEIDWEYGMSFFEIELADGTELYFSQDGTFLCNDDDDGDDDDGDDDDGDDDDGDDDDGDDDDDDDDDYDDNIYTTINAYIQANYSGSSIDEIDRERLCGGVQAYEVELEGEDIKLYFDTDGDFLYSAQRIEEQDLPQAVTDAIASTYAGYQVEDDDVRELLMEDGSKQYQVEIRQPGDDDDDIQAIFSEDGSLICSED
ncbi:MAG: PepSY-like domain-containing protein [Phaeodactylibacter sp.]|nr:PepSY-like domain-containing protein [Phaeodactylibacter sp.]MCB9050059.1 PepSY-like domain-containing protein [Lewinellaceae bacterium]